MTDLNTQKASTSDNGSEREQITPFGQLLDRAHLIPQPFTSKLPLIGPVIVWFRSAWNSVSTRWYLAPLLQQQSEFNYLVTHELRVLTDKLHVLRNELGTVAGDLNNTITELNTVNGKLHALEGTAHTLTTERQELRQLIDEISERLIANDKDVVTLSHDLGKVTYALIRLSESQTASSDGSKG